MASAVLDMDSFDEPLPCGKSAVLATTSTQRSNETGPLSKSQRPLSPVNTNKIQSILVSNPKHLPAPQPGTPCRPSARSEGCAAMATASARKAPRASSPGRTFLDDVSVASPMPGFPRSRRASVTIVSPLREGERPCNHTETMDSAQKPPLAPPHALAAADLPLGGLVGGECMATTPLKQQNAAGRSYSRRATPTRLQAGGEESHSAAGFPDPKSPAPQHPLSVSRMRNHTVSEEIAAMQQRDRRLAPAGPERGGRCPSPGRRDASSSAARRAASLASLASIHDISFVEAYVGDLHEQLEAEARQREALRKEADRRAAEERAAAKKAEAEAKRRAREAAKRQKEAAMAPRVHDDPEAEAEYEAAVGAAAAEKKRPARAGQKGTHHSPAGKRDRRRQAASRRCQEEEEDESSEGENIVPAVAPRCVASARTTTHNAPAAAAFPSSSSSSWPAPLSAFAAAAAQPPQRGQRLSAPDAAAAAAAAAAAIAGSKRRRSRSSRSDGDSVLDALLAAQMPLPVSRGRIVAPPLAAQPPQDTHLYGAAIIVPRRGGAPNRRQAARSKSGQPPQHLLGAVDPWITLAGEADDACPVVLPRASGRGGAATTAAGTSHNSTNPRRHAAPPPQPAATAHGLPLSRHEAGGPAMAAAPARKKARIEEAAAPVSGRGSGAALGGGAGSDDPMAVFFDAAFPSALPAEMPFDEPQARTAGHAYTLRAPKQARR